MHDGRLAASASAGPRIYLELTRQKLSRAKRVKNYHVKQPAGPWLAERSPFEPRYLFRFPRSFLFPHPFSLPWRRFLSPPANFLLPRSLRVRVFTAPFSRGGGGRCCIAIASVKAASANKPTPPPPSCRSLSFQRSRPAIIGEWWRVGMKGGKKTTSLNLCKNLVCCSTEKGAKSRIGE